MIRIIHSIPALKDNYIYALENENGSCAIIDPGEADPVLEFLSARKLKLEAILCTHHHADHTGGIAGLLQHFQVPIWTSVEDFERVPGASKTVTENDDLSLFGETVKVLAVPGHTLGQISFFFPRLEAVFVGDTLFSCGCGRMFEGTYPQFFASLQKLKALPPTTQIYFGHEYTLRNIAFLCAQGEVGTRLLQYQNDCEHRRARGEFTTPGQMALEREINPFLRANSVAEFKHWREARNTW